MTYDGSNRPCKAPAGAGGGGGGGAQGVPQTLTPLPDDGSCPGSVRKRPAKKQAAHRANTGSVPKPCCLPALAGFRSGFGLVIGCDFKGEGLATPSWRGVASFGAG